MLLAFHTIKIFDAVAYIACFVLFTPSSCYEIKKVNKCLF